MLYCNFTTLYYILVSIFHVRNGRKWWTWSKAKTILERFFNLMTCSFQCKFTKISHILKLSLQILWDQGVNQYNFNFLSFLVLYFLQGLISAGWNVLASDVNVCAVLCCRHGIFHLHLKILSSALCCWSVVSCSSETISTIHNYDLHMRWT